MVVRGEAGGGGRGGVMNRGVGGFVSGSSMALLIEGRCVCVCVCVCVMLRQAIVQSIQDC